VFFGAAALSFRKGVMVFDPEAPRNLLQTAKERILVLDSSKIDQEALYGYCGLDQCDLIITDSGVETKALERLRKLRKVVVAE
jgi:DeoR/GlpR family transcriptional regulator of sugar metabolism